MDYIAVLCMYCVESVAQHRLFSSDMDAEDAEECKASVEKRNWIRNQQTLVGHVQYRHKNPGSRVGGPEDGKGRE